MQFTASHTLAGGAPVTRSFSQTWDGLKCRPTQLRLEPGSSQWRVTYGLAYDDFGNVASRTVTGAGMSARKMTQDWGSRGQLPVGMTNPLSQMTAIGWDYGTGLPTSMTDPNALTVSWAYDAFGRLTGEIRPDQTTTQWLRAACTNDCDSRTRFQLTQYEKDNAGVIQRLAVIDVDRLGRAFRSSIRQPGGGTTVVAADTDAAARRLFTSAQQQFTNMVRNRRGKLQPPIDDIETYWTPTEKAQASGMLRYAIVGGPEAIKRGLDEFVAHTGVDELMVVAAIHDHAARKRSYEILAGAGVLRA